jgi:tRNA(Ile)-lysidine synthase TilS/MesJ
MPVDDQEICFSDAVDIYRKYIFDRLARIPLLEKEGRAYVSFSGGVDSSLTARVLLEQGLEVILVTAGLRGAKDLE